MTDRVPTTESPAPGRAAPSPDTSSSARTTAALSGLVLGAGQAGIAAEAPPPGRPRRIFRRPPAHPRNGSSSLPTDSREPVSQQSASAETPTTEQAAPDTTSELRNWIKDNATLLSNASLLISVAALALNLLPDTGVLDPYIKALIFGAALLLLIEMHYQWPADLQLHMFRSMSLPQNHSWRMVAFAFIMQVATVAFAVWATLNTPLILIPLTALGVVVAFRQWYFRRFRGIAARGFGILVLIVALLLSELLMVVVWAVIADETITIELWTEERPGFTLETSPDP